MSWSWQASDYLDENEEGNVDGDEMVSMEFHM